MSTGVYGQTNYTNTSVTTTYAYLSIISARYYDDPDGAGGLPGTGALYSNGTSIVYAYNETLALIPTVSSFFIEPVVRAFAKDQGISRTFVFNSSDPVVISAASDLSAEYTFDLVVTPPVLSSLKIFASEQVIEAESMSDNFRLISRVIGLDNTPEQFDTKSALSFDGTAGSLVELSTGEVVLSHQAKITTTLDGPVTRVIPANVGTSDAVVLYEDGLRVLSGTILSGEVELRDIFRIENNVVSIPVAIVGDTASENRMLYQPFAEPVLVAGISKDLTTIQEVPIDMQGRLTSAVDVMVRIGVTSTRSLTATVYNTELGERLGATLYVPESSSLSERFITRRFRVALNNSRIAIKLSDKCSTLELRILGTWG